MSKHTRAHPAKPLSCGARRRHLHLWLLGGLAALVLGGCASTKVQTMDEETKGQRLPRPERIFVYDFAVSPDDINLDRGVSADLARLARGTPRTAQELNLGRQVAAALSEHLAQEIKALGLPAERATGFPARSGAGTTLLIEGHLLSIDQGNRTERMIIGLGMGRSEVEAHVQVYEMTPEGQRKVEDLQATAKGAIKPGMGEMMGLGALTGNLLTATIVSGTVGIASEATVDNVQADARRLAKGISQQLQQLFTSQGWI